MLTRRPLRVSVLLALALTACCSAWANQPETTIVSADATFTNDFDCAFPLQEQISGQYRDTLYFDRNDLLTREFLSPAFQSPLLVTWLNPATGTTLSSHEANPLTIYWNPDGSFQSASNRGLTFHVSVPGMGHPLLLDVGLIIIRHGQGITFEVGQHQELDGDTAAFCGYLASAH